MSIKRIIGIFLILIGIGFFAVSYYIQGQVDQGKEQISDAQQKVDTADQLFSLTPTTKQLGSQFTGSAQKKIDEGKIEVQEYETLSGQLKIGSIVALALGLLVLIVSKKKNH